MKSSIRMMLTCRWSARRIQRYLDADPSAPLTAADVTRLEAHLAVCDRCTAAVDEVRGIKSALGRLAEIDAPDPAQVARLRLESERLAHEEMGEW